MEREDFGSVRRLHSTFLHSTLFPSIFHFSFFWLGAMNLELDNDVPVDFVYDGKTQRVLVSPSQPFQEILGALIAPFGLPSGATISVANKQGHVASRTATLVKADAGPWSLTVVVSSVPTTFGAGVRSKRKRNVTAISATTPGAGASVLGEGKRITPLKFCKKMDTIIGAAPSASVLKMQPTKALEALPLNGAQKRKLDKLHPHRWVRCVSLSSWFCLILRFASFTGPKVGHVEAISRWTQGLDHQLFWQCAAGLFGASCGLIRVFVAHVQI